MRALTAQKSGLMTESDFRSVMGELQSNFEALSKYMFQTHRKNADDSIFLWDSSDSPAPFDIYGVVALYTRIYEKWGTEISHAEYPDFLHETDSTFLGYLKALRRPYFKLGAHADALKSAYENAAKGSGGADLEAMSTERLSESLASADQKTVTEAFKALARRGKGDPLIAKLKDPDPRTRYRMAYAMWEYVINAYDVSNDQFYSTMLSLLSDPDEGVREQSVGYFWSLRDLRQKARIAKMLEDRSPKVRIAAASYLGYGLKSKEHRPALTVLLKDEDDSVRKAAAEVLKELDKTVK